MRFGFTCILSLIIIASGASAATVLLSTTNHPLGNSSRLTVDLLLLGQPVSISDVAISGTVPTVFNLNGSNTGTILADNPLGGALTLGNASRSFSGVLLSGTVETVNVGASLDLGPESVVNRNLFIDSSTGGGVFLDSGKLRFTFTGGALQSVMTGYFGGNVGEFDLSLAPIGILFSDFGSTVLNATTDQDSSGLDPDGAELNLPLAYFTSTYPGVLNGFGVLASASGNLYLGSDVVIPEIGSFGLLSLAVAGIGSFVVVCRRARA